MRDSTDSGPPVPVPRSRLAPFFAALLLASLGLGGSYLWQASFVVDGQRVFSLWDDAMISMQYARNLAEGHGLVWNPGGEPVQGFTNLGVTLTMAAVHGLPLDEFRIALAFQILEILVLAAILVFVWRAARQIDPGDPLIAGIASVSTLLCAPLCIWGAQGGDAAFVSLWLVISVTGAVRAWRTSGTWSWALAAWIAAGILIRPDTTIFVAVFVALAASGPGPAARNAARTAIAAACAWGAFLTFGQVYYGDPLPNTWYLKGTGTSVSLRLASGFRQIGSWLPRLAPALAFSAYAIHRNRKRSPVLLCGGLVGVAFAYHVWVGGDWMWKYGSRFAAPALPLLLLLSALGVREAVAQWRHPRLPARAAWAVASAIALAVAVFSNPSGTLAEWLEPWRGTMMAEHNYRNFRYATYFREHTTPDTTLALHWGGVPRYFSHREGLDVLGRSDRHIAKTLAQGSSYRPGHAKWDWDYVVNVRKPDIVIGESRGLRDRDDFRREYVLVKGPRRGFYVRKTSLAKLLDENLVLEDLDTGRRTPRRNNTTQPLDPGPSHPQDDDSPTQEIP